MISGVNSSFVKAAAKYSNRPFLKKVEVVFTHCESFSPTINKPFSLY